MADLEHIIACHPRLYHMAEVGSWDNIRQRGLLSTAALLDLYEVEEPRRSNIKTQYRPKDEVICHSEHGQATIRRQTSMPTDKLRTALTDMKPWEWYKLLNSKVFFWSTRSRLHGFMAATAHKYRPHDVLIVCTRSLIEKYMEEITLSPINSGSVRDVRHTRGSHTLQTIPDYRCTNRQYKRTRECFAELAVEGSVLDLERHTLSVDRWMGANCIENIWHR